MEPSGGLGFSSMTGAARKKRSITARRPRNDSQSLADFGEVSPSSFAPPFDNNVLEIDDGRSEESEETSNNTSFPSSGERKHSGDDSKRPSEGVLAPTNWRRTSDTGQFGVVPDRSGNENKVKKVKLKVGGVTRTINAKSITDNAEGPRHSSAKPYGHSDMDFEDNSDDNRYSNVDNWDILHGSMFKEYSKSGLRGDGSRNRTPYEGKSTNQVEKNKPVRKSKRFLKKRFLDGDSDDDEIRYIEKVKRSKARRGHIAEYVDDEEGGSRKQRKISMVLKRKVDDLYDVNIGDYSSSKSGKKSRSERESEDTDYLEDEEPDSDGELEIKRGRKEFVNFLDDTKEEMTVTTRRRARQAGKDVSSTSSLIEFPEGLPPAPPKKQKEKLSEVEQQLKRAEALQRRRMQVEKAARESEAEAIRKILGQDSSRKKRENKMKKRQEELAQERAANAMILASDTVRWNIGPSGTVVTFPNEMGLPSIFNSKPCRYPPPREKCAGPSCTNPYKYRDSKSKLPLCSLQCYKAIHGKTSLLTTAC